MVDGKKYQVCLDQNKFKYIENHIVDYIRTKPKKSSLNLYMTKQVIKKKYIFLGDVNSINVELILKSFEFLKNKVKYILICDKIDLTKNKYFKKKILINEILDPINFLNYNKNNLNIYNVASKRKKYQNLLYQIEVANKLANITKYDLVTMPINKAIFKKELNFTGMTEYLGKINKKFTIMLMNGDTFSVIPITTHINIKDVNKYISSKNIHIFLNKIFNYLDNKTIILNLMKLSFYVITPIVVRREHSK